MYIIESIAYCTFIWMTFLTHILFIYKFEYYMIIMYNCLMARNTEFFGTKVKYFWNHMRFDNSSNEIVSVLVKTQIGGKRKTWFEISKPRKWLINANIKHMSHQDERRLKQNISFFLNDYLEYNTSKKFDLHI